MNLPGFPVSRPRRLRQSPALRRLVCETRLSVEQLVLPLFARSGRKLRREIDAMPGVFQFSPDEVLREAARAHALGVPAVLLFGIPDTKDAKASGAYAKNGIVQQTVRLLKKELPSLLVITDVCLCEYMEHGHCGVVERRTPVRPVDGKSGRADQEIGAPIKILNDPSLEVAGANRREPCRGGRGHRRAERHDGRPRGRDSRRAGQNGFIDTPIMSYAAKFASAFYGPFREAAESAPKFGDRRSYQMDAANANEALREVALDIREGADIVMVKPALAYLDLIHRVKTEFGYPTAAYAVSGEHAMIKAAAAKGWIDERAVTLESLLAMRRAGADILITYAAADAAKWMK